MKRLFSLAACWLLIACNQPIEETVEVSTDEGTSVALADIVEFWDSRDTSPGEPVKSFYVSTVLDFAAAESGASLDEFVQTIIAETEGLDSETDVQRRLWEGFLDRARQGVPHSEIGFIDLVTVYVQPNREADQARLVELLSLAESGYLPAQLAIWNIYATDGIVEADYELALRNLRLAADTDYFWAVERLAQEYWVVGFDTPAQRNPELAFEYYSRAAELGSVDAHGTVAEMHFIGSGTERSAELGWEWLLRSADLGNRNSTWYLCSNELPRSYGPEEVWRSPLAISDANRWCRIYLERFNESPLARAVATRLGLRYLDAEESEQASSSAYYWLYIARAIEPGAGNSPASYAIEFSDAGFAEISLNNALANAAAMLSPAQVSTLQIAANQCIESAFNNCLP